MVLPTHLLILVLVSWPFFVASSALYLSQDEGDALPDDPLSEDDANEADNEDTIAEKLASDFSNSNKVILFDEYESREVPFEEIAAKQNKSRMEHFQLIKKILGNASLSLHDKFVTTEASQINDKDDYLKSILFRFFTQRIRREGNDLFLHSSAIYVPKSKELQNKQRIREMLHQMVEKFYRILIRTISKPDEEDEHFPFPEIGARGFDEDIFDEGFGQFSIM